MKRLTCILFIIVVLAFMAACDKGEKEDLSDTDFISITSEEAKNIMDSEEHYVILDVRTQEEYDKGHIKNAVLIPDYEINEMAEEMLPDKEQLILVYCRSGRRSKIASENLADMGYSNIREFGGIIDWEYEIER